MPERRTRDVEHHPLERVTDRSRFAVVNAKIGEYRLLLYPLFAVLIAVGFKFQGPGARISAVEKDVSEMKTIVRDSISALRVGQMITHNKIDVLVRLRCFDTTVTTAQKLLAGLDCSEIDQAKRDAFERARRDSVNKRGF